MGTGRMIHQLIYFEYQRNVKKESKESPKSTSFRLHNTHRHTHTHTPFAVLDKIESEREVLDGEAALWQNVTVVEDVNNGVQRRCSVLWRRETKR